MSTLDALQEPSGLGPFLDALTRAAGPYEVVDHWQQGEFHHDLVVRLKDSKGLPAPVVVIATNCNAGIKEVLWFERPPERWALWNWRCPDNPALKPSCRRKAKGGGWEPI